MISLLILVTTSSLILKVVNSATNFKPSFTEFSPIIIQVAENSPVGTSVYTLNATDQENDNVKFSLDDVGKTLFNINESTGELTIKSTSLDRESKNLYEFTTYVEDDYNGGGDARKVEIKVNLYLTDANDNSPIFQNIPYIASLPENATIGTTLLEISATDADTGSNGQMVFSFDPPQSNFELTPLSNGRSIIKLKQPLDYEITQRYTFFVIAKDKGNPPLSRSTTVVIHVEDESDQPPQFLQSTYLMQLTENLPTGTHVGVVKAIDGDIGVNNPIKYSIISGNMDYAFVLDEKTGSIKVNQSIDMETVSSYELIIMAVEIPDPTFNTSVNVFIVIVDQNDNKPRFLQTSYYTKINKYAPVGYKLRIPNFAAEDKDRSLKYKEFEYKLEGGDGKFSIDNITGEVTVMSELNYENDTQDTLYYSFTVFAQEIRSTEAFSSNVTVTVEVNFGQIGEQFETRCPKESSCKSDGAQLLLIIILEAVIIVVLVIVLTGTILYFKLRPKKGNGHGNEPGIVLEPIPSDNSDNDKTYMQLVDTIGSGKSQPPIYQTLSTGIQSK